MKNIAIIPARSGSKGLIAKNIKKLCGLPLLAYSIQAAYESGLFEEIMVSTDSQQYAEIAKQYGASVPFLRSEEQSGDNAGSWDVVKEVLNRYFEEGICFETVCLLQPTSPLRKADDIINGYRLFQDKSADAVTAVCEMDHSPLWSMVLPEDLSLVEYREKHTNTCVRQKLDKYYRINGALYIRKIVYNKSSIDILDKNEYAYIMGRNRSVDIDVEEDFQLAEYLIKKSHM
jgi:CMP-N,N'-diacetyllegionaminic acid synthase